MIATRHRRRAALAAGFAGLALLGGCSVADNLSAGEILEEIDAIVRIEGTGDDRRIDYLERVQVSSWYMRAFLLVPVRGVLAWTFGRRQEVTLEHPSAHVRELLRELPDETGADLLTCAYSVSRFGWLAELDRNPETRVLALDGLAAMSGQLGLEPFAADFDELMVPADQEALALARAGVLAGRPEARAGAAWPDASLEPYRDALATLTGRPLDGWAERLLLIEDLSALRAAENDRRVRPWIDAALRAALRHGIAGVLLRAVQSREPRLAEVRMCAMEQIRRLGGPRVVPLLLAVMASSPAQLARGDSRFDPDPLVQLRLIHYCGQLSRDLAETAVRLPGRADWEATAPVDFLANTVLGEQEYYSRLRTPALVALAWCLRRERLDPDPNWVRAWREQRGS